ncbi:unnamed protein product [Ectocarpus fasciculatus]
MDLELVRADLLQLDPVSNFGTIALLPKGKKGKQKIVVGDDSGSIHCYEFKKGEAHTVFSVRPFQTPVSCVVITGIAMKGDKIFATSGQQVVGINKKGKEFFRLTSPLTEEMRTIVVDDTKIWSSCEFIFNLYDNGQDTGFYMCADQINDMTIDKVTRDTEYEAILACQDNRLRVIQGSSLGFEVRTVAPVSAVVTVQGDDLRRQKGGVGMIFGMVNGGLSMVEAGATGTNKYWSLDDGVKKNRINCIKLWDVTRDGTPDIIVCRDDGRLEIFSMDKHNRGPVKIFTRDIGESIKGVDVGFVNSTEHPEILVVGYSGKVVSFTTEPIQSRAPGDSYGRSVQTMNDENRIKQMKKEIDELQAKVDKESDRLRAEVSKAGGRSATGAVNGIPQVRDFPINCQFSLDDELGAYVLSTEIQTNIDLVLMSSPVPLTLVDSEVGNAVASLSTAVDVASLDGKTNRFVATFRCQSGDQRRLSVAVRTNEGEFGDIFVTVVTATEPKAAKVLRFPLRPLSLHMRIHSFSTAEVDRPKHRLVITGTMAISVIHEWMVNIFPEVPPNIAEGSTEERMTFRNAFAGGVCSAEYRSGEMTFECDSASTLAIIKENISRLGTARRVRLDERVHMSEVAIPVYLDLLFPKLEYQVSLARKFNLIDAVAEIALQEPDTRWLSAEYAEILRDQEKIRREYKDRTRVMHYLTGIITDLFIDWKKLIGQDGRLQIGILNEAIEEANLEALRAVFLESLPGT